MDPLIKAEIDKAKEQVAQDFKEDISDDRAFSYVAVNNYFRTGELSQITDIHGMITDGANDGGIDFVYFDDDKPAVIVGQSKCVSSIQVGDIVDEVRKMRDSVAAFRSGHAGMFNKNVQRELQEALDALPDEYPDSIEYVFFTSAEVDEKSLLKKLTKTLDGFEANQFTLQQGSDIVSSITLNMEDIDVVSEDYVGIDATKNVLEYGAPNGRRGVFVNVSSKSIERLYRKYIDRGLLSLNIRGYIKNKSIDSGIIGTLNKERDNFWFYNNGLTIACSDFWQDGTRIKMTDFSIVNGGQTTTLIGKYTGSNVQDNRSSDRSGPAGLLHTHRRGDELAEADQVEGPQVELPRDAPTEEMAHGIGRVPGDQARRPARQGVELPYLERNARSALALFRVPATRSRQVWKAHNMGRRRDLQQALQAKLRAVSEQAGFHTRPHRPVQALQHHRQAIQDGRFAPVP